jgi:uncharacterized protein (TIGR03435 family)
MARMSRRCLPLLVAAVLGAPAAVLTQGGPAPSLAFDVASVKESESLELDGVFQNTPGRFTVTNLSVRWIMRYAFRLRDYQVIGAPAWTETRYQIDARFGNAAATDEEVRDMLRRLLADRFALRTRREQRTIPIYELKRARADGTLGPKLTPPRKDCEGRYCMFQTGGSIKGFARTMAQLTPVLDAVIKGPVVDRTGLTGTFDFDLTWGDDGDPTKDPSDQTPERRADLLTALREQLGLTLDATRAPYDVLVIESISRPTPN